MEAQDYQFLKISLRAGDEDTVVLYVAFDNELAIAFLGLAHSCRSRKR